MPFRTMLLLFTCCMIGVLLYFTGRLIFTLTTDIYQPLGVLFYLPWSLGLCGLIGLISVLRDPAYKSPVWHKADIVLLTLGIVGAAGFLLVTLYVFRSFTLNLLSPGFNMFFSLSILISVMLPCALAIREIFRARGILRSSPMVDKRQFRGVLVCIGLLVLIVPAGRIVGQELVILWYGRNLTEAAYASAEQIAKGTPYCVHDDHGATRFEDLAKRRILMDALDKRFGFHGMNYIGADPHFGIMVNGQDYWWSFKKRQFLILPGRNFGYKFRDCDNQTVNN